MILNPRHLGRCAAVLHALNKTGRKNCDFKRLEINSAKSPQFVLSRHLSDNSPAPSQEELKIKTILAKSFPSADSIVVEDISGKYKDKQNPIICIWFAMTWFSFFEGGCGSMFQIHVESSDFKGMSIVKQHQLITKVRNCQPKRM